MWKNFSGGSAPPDPLYFQTKSFSSCLIIEYLGFTGNIHTKSRNKISKIYKNKFEGIRPPTPSISHGVVCVNEITSDLHKRWYNSHDIETSWT